MIKGSRLSDLLGTDVLDTLIQEHQVRVHVLGTHRGLIFADRATSGLRSLRLGVRYKRQAKS